MPDSANLLDHFRRDRAKGPNADIELSLRPAFHELLKKLGSPHKKLPPVFHVAGTNGKGSTCAFLRAMLEAGGYRVHVYTSPHLVHFHERIRIAGQLITENELCARLQSCIELSEPGSVTYFEAATAVAFASFAEHPADFTILEVGLGGRLDATNVVPTVLTSIITRLSFDHREYLGSTIESIAAEKAGIMRPHTPCFAAAQPDPAAIETLSAAAKKIGTSLFVADRDWRVERHETGFVFHDKTHHINLPSPGLVGSHQYGNASLAVSALLGAGVKLTDQSIAQGLQNIEWPARLQKLQHGPLARLLPEGWELWLDGGHNDSAGDALAEQAKIWQADHQHSLHLIMGMLTSKQPTEFFRLLHPFVSCFMAVPIPEEPASFTPKDLAEAAQQSGIEKTATADSVQAAIEIITAGHQQRSRILICGSLYLAGHVLAK